MKNSLLSQSHGHCGCGCKDVKPVKVESKSCDCGCGCEASPCTCGCQEGKDCTCGCQDGKDCTCSDDPEPRRRSTNNKLTKSFKIARQHNLGGDPHRGSCLSGSCDCGDTSCTALGNKGKTLIQDDGCDCGDTSCTALGNKGKTLIQDDGCGCMKCADMSIASSPTAPQRRGRLLRAVVQITLSVALLLLGTFLTLPAGYELFFIIPSLLVIGGEYIYKAMRNLVRGKILDENLLMSIAAIGALIIGEYIEGIAVMLLYTVGEALQDLAVTRSKRSVSDLLSLKTNYANRLTGDTLTKIDSSEIVIGDMLVVANGERVPTDGTVLSGTGSVDASMLTGEYKPISLHAGDTVPCGSIVKGNSITITVSKLFGDTTAARIMDLVMSASDKKPKTQQFITKFAKYYTPIVVLIAFIVAFIPPIFLGFGQYFSQYLHKALVFLVISCPCALVISVPLGYFAGIGGAARRSILFKGGNYMEALSTVDTVVLDKTGTLTEGVFEVEDIVPHNYDTMSLLTLAAYAESRSNHPIARSIASHNSIDIDQSRISEYTEIDGMGISLMLDGINVLCGKAELLLLSGIDGVSSPVTAATVIHLSLDGGYVGYITINDRLKASAAQMVEGLRAMGKKVIIMSGDRREAVAKVAGTLGVDGYHYGLLPQDKATLVEGLLKEGCKVAFVGDGLNDAPVLKLATVGICIGGINNDASIEAADIVLGGNDIGSLVTAFKSSHKTRGVVGQNIALSLVTKLIIMLLSVTVAPYMWLALVADVGVSLLAVVNSLRAMKV